MTNEEIQKLNEITNWLESEKIALQKRIETLEKKIAQLESNLYYHINSSMG